MATMAGPRKSRTIYDYPEHLNPFREEDNHNKIRFWTIGRKLNRSNSITFKDLKNSWSFRSFMKKGKRQQPPEKEKPNNQANGDHLVEYRKALLYSSTSQSPQARNTVSSPERADRYVYGGSVTPLPRSRFQERLRSNSNYEVNSLSVTPRMARSEISGSRHSVGSTNPFDEEDPVPPVRAPRRKKKRAAPLPPVASGSNITDNSILTDDASKLDSSSLNTLQNTDLNDTRTTDINDTKTSSLNVTKESNLDNSKPSNTEEVEDSHWNIELKIVEDDDDVQTKRDADKTDIDKEDLGTNISVATSLKTQHNEDEDLSLKIEENSNIPNTVKSTGSEDDIINKASFPKVDIVTYRRNSSVNDDDIRLRRGNLEDFHALSNKRSKSLTNTLDGSYIAYDINLNEDQTTKDANDNDAPQKVVCKVYEDAGRKQSVETVSSTETQFIEIDKATRELEREISKLNSALIEDDLTRDVSRRSVSDMKRLFDKSQTSSPNPIPKPRRSHHGDISTLAINGNGHT